ncbi:Beta-N-acetylhexosaminidase [Catenulispora acidiphila DSM 44928]|uniref:beta-N-acetylhexosaminidase n=1 Tax=Catenulispora acidiphila (strain DSM 44928 / JCM 14897 / NBRC 102108 / NRRL B-24433 / ID139908) TaxID=479433 RepID=C7Q714_CATAD|nr:beta-N-acetylhexosaminidase [Catenulispora acidiphila]ACU76027.1 Beta-N-acetylhexosaminidase [Catenulispora acidiphila DSM 44928]
MIIPRPAEYTARSGEFVLGPALNLAAGPGAERPADLLAAYLGAGRPRTGAGPAVALRLDDGAHDHPHGYDLLVTPEQVTLTAPSEAGLFNGVQTLRQLLPAQTLSADPAVPADAWRWPACHVRDAPRLAWRGVMLDVARHFMPIEFLYRLADEIALHKINILHLHLTDDQGWRVEIDGLPRLTEIGSTRTASMVGRAGSTVFDGVPHSGYYTRRELADLVEYAAARGVTIVPEIGMPSHTRAALAAYPELGNHPETALPVWTSWGISEDILAVHDEALDFCQHVLSDVMTLFPSRNIHIGGDECRTVQWEDNADARRRIEQEGLPNVSELLGWFLSQMHGYLAEHRRRAVCWNDAVGVGNLDPGVVATAWLKPEHAAEAIARGHQVIVAPHEHTYLDYRQTSHPAEPPSADDRVLTLAEAYSFDPLPTDLSALGVAALTDASGGPGVLGTQAQLWTESAPTTEVVRHLLYPRLCALAEGAWSDERRDPADFARRLQHHLLRLDALGALPAARPDGWDPGAGLSMP